MRIGDYELSSINGKSIITGEYMTSGSMIKVEFKYWESADGNVKRYYINRANEPIGYVNADYTDGKGKTSTNQLYINRMLEVLKNA